MNALDRITHILHRRLLAGGWSDEDAAAEILETLGLDAEGIRLIDWSEAPWPPTSSNIGHG